LRPFPYILAAAVLAISALPAYAADPTYEVFAISAQNGSGESGAVILTPVGTKTKVEVLIANAPVGVPQPTHVHVGPCAKLDPKPTYPLSPALNGLSVTTLDVPIATLINGTFAVNVHKSATNIPAYVACGDLILPK
jgi:hypothetical protein